MEEIKVGEYIRTKKGYIYKIKNIIDSHKCKNSYLVRANGDDFNFFINKETILKHSPNIIEVGDALKIIENGIISIAYLDTKDYLETWLEDIEKGYVKVLSVVTKEKFKDLEYKVEE